MSQPLRIGIDARELLGDPTGVGRYLGELLLRWTSRPDADRRRFILYASSPLQIRLPGGLVEQRIGGSGRGTWWEQTWLRRAAGADRPDVFFAPAYTAPLAIGSPLAVTIHDVSFAAHPEWFRPREGLRRRWLTRRAARSASVILTVSEFSAREIERCLGVPSSQIQVVLNGLSGTVPASRLGAGTAARPVRWLDLQSPAGAGPDCRLCARQQRTCPTRGSSSSATTAPGRGRTSPRSPGLTAWPDGRTSRDT